MMLNKYLLIGSLLLLLSGCGSVNRSKGVQVELYPITTQLTLNIVDVKDASQRVDDFLQQHANELSSAKFTFIYQTDVARKLSILKRKKLIKSGIEDSQIELRKSASQEMQFTLQMVTLLMKNDSCPEISYRSMKSNKNMYGCTVETNRWKSMVHPERSAGAMK